MERDYPIGHPAASDYKGEPYTDAFASYAFDFPAGHAARGGKNRSDVDTPDGMREAHLHQANKLVDLAKSGSLPPLFAFGQKEPLPLAPEALAHIYAARQTADFTKPAREDDKIALGYIVDHVHNIDDAIELYKSYAQPPQAASGTKE
jgi:hypothetical protein